MGISMGIYVMDGNLCWNVSEYLGDIYGIYGLSGDIMG
jgi:hypothetical protein